MSGTSGIVAYNFNAWIAAYPEFAQSVNATQGAQYFNLACLQLDNTGCSPIADYSVGGVRETILYLITAHIAALMASVAGSNTGGIVGRISTASEGSVSVTAELPLMPGTASWWAQTRYGLMAWQSLAPYRVARYVRGPGIPLSMQSYPMRGQWG